MQSKHFEPHDWGKGNWISTANKLPPMRDIIKDKKTGETMWEESRQVPVKVKGWAGFSIGHLVRSKFEDRWSIHWVSGDPEVTHWFDLPEFEHHDRRRK